MPTQSRTPSAAQPGQRFTVGSQRYRAVGMPGTLRVPAQSELMVEVRALVARMPRRSAGVESSREPVPSEFRRKHAHSH
jgi:hypothetical protein